MILYAVLLNILIDCQVKPHYPWQSLFFLSISRNNLL